MDITTQPYDPKPTNRRYWVLLFLCILSFLTYFDRVCIARAQRDIQAELTINDEQMGLIFGAFWLAYALFEIPGGWMGDRYGARITLTRIVGAWSVLTILSGAALGFRSLLTCRFLFGVGEAGAYPNMARVMGRWLPPRTRARAGGLLWLLARWGGAFSPLIFGSMLRFFDAPGFRSLIHHVGLPADISAWRLAFWAAGLLGVCWCLAFTPWFRDDPAQASGVNRAELRLIQEGNPPRVESHSMPGSAWKALLVSRSLWAMGLLYIMSSFGWSFFVSWLPRYLEDVYGVKFENSELISGMPLFFGGISCLLGGTLSDLVVRRTGRKWLGRAIFPMTGYAVAGIAMFCIRFTKTVEMATVLMCLANVGNDFGQGANWATIVDIGGRFAGTATGLINMIGNAGNYLQPLIGALISQRFGWDPMMVVYSVMFFGAATMWLFIDPTRTFYHDNSA